jgi:hypothetical protein
MNNRFGVSTSICAEEIKRLAQGAGSPAREQLLRDYLNLLDDFAGFVLKNGFASATLGGAGLLAWQP